MRKTLSREARICIAIWRKAYLERDKEPLVINAANYSAAISIRQALYRAIHPYRNNELFDEELFQASEKIVPYIPKARNLEAPHQIIMKSRVALGLLENELEALGISEIDLITPEEQEITKRINQEVKELIETKAKTPYY